MPEEEILEESVLNPVMPEVQDPLLRALLADEPAPVDTPQEQPQALASHRSWSSWFCGSCGYLVAIIMAHSCSTCAGE